MFEKINEQIEILVNFTFQEVYPMQITWRKRTFDIKNMDFYHTSKEGNVLLHHFAVSTETESFKITLNASNLVWTLNEIYTTGFIKQSFNDRTYDMYRTKKNHYAH